MTFVHLHNHTHYSLLDGLAKPIDYIMIAKEQGSGAVAITDHGVLYGAIEMYQKAQENDIKPIIGCEVYLARGSRHEKRTGIDNKYYHLTLLSETNEGYENLIQLVTLAHLEGFYYRPRIDKELLRKYHKGLICLSGCLQSEISQSITSGKTEKALELIKEYQDIFGSENFFLEVMHHPELELQEKVNDFHKTISKEAGSPLVATNDSHYARREDAEAHDALICIQTQTHVHDDERMRYRGNYSLRPVEEMIRAFQDIPQAIENTKIIADRCKVKMKFGRNLIPAFKTEENKSSKEYLEELCQKGFAERYGEHPSEEATKRLTYELHIIHTMGFDTYFLIVQDFVRFAKERGIFVGPGRGSAAGSIIAYCLGITDIDPLKYHLLFERFLNPERISMPDIDIDFADDRRDEVLEYVVEKYGKDKVAQIITFGTMAARAAVRDVGRALGIKYADVDAIAKMIPSRPGTKLKEALEEAPDLKTAYQASAINTKLIDTALKLEGCIRHASVHACAVVISAEPLTTYTPLQKAPGNDDAIITQFSMKPIDDIGLLKMDFLGLKNLTILENTLQMIERTKGEIIDLKKIPLDDTKTFKLMAEGKTTGVFQFESGGMRRYLRDLKPTRFEDLIAMNALYRPGPMDWIPDYIRGKHEQHKIKYLHPSFKDILEETYGVAVYQEQILQIAQMFAGFSLGEADILRKAVGKKIGALLTKQRSKFISGAKAKGHSEKFAIQVFENVIEPFAGYGFNKAHATCYAMIAYETAWLKTRYPAEFMSALLTADEENLDRVALEINECEEMGITVLPPDINESLAHFTTVDDRTIRFGLSAIKGVGGGTIEEIINARKKHGKFHSIDDFSRRVPIKVLNKKTIESLARCGAMDCFGERNALASSVEEMVNYAKNIQQSLDQGQTDIFSMLTEEEKQAPSFHLAVIEPASLLQRLRWEKEYLGLFVSSHPLDGLKKYFGKKVNLIEKLKPKDVGKTIKIGGIIIKAKKIFTRNGSNMMYLTVEDPTGRMEITVFPKVYGQYKDVLQENNIVVVSGRLEKRNGQMQCLCQEAKRIDLEKLIENAKKEGFFDEKHKVMRTLRDKENDDEMNENNSENGTSKEKTAVDEKIFTIKIPASSQLETLEKIKKILENHKGDDGVEIHIVGEKTLKRIRLPFRIKIDKELKSAMSKVI
ncbi:DNA polymerase III subunit alpha [Candidatus Peregrinibacteria bacterium]|nr:DNA polymerase III subunit alpha [Candidatus Peregrinibacteria bacterium]